jgi:hypothetical protein
MCLPFVAVPAAAAAGSSAATVAAANAAIAMAVMTNAAITSTILSVAGSAVGFYGQQQQASYQEKSANYQYQVQQMNRTAAEQSQQRQFEITSQEAENAAKMAYLLSAKRQQEFEQQAASEILAVSQQSAKAAGLARVSASEAGVAGTSVDALLKDFSRQELSYQTSVLREQESQARMFGIEREGIRQQQYSRLLGAAPQPLPVIGAPVIPPRPTFLAAGLQMGQAVTGLFANPYFASSLALQGGLSGGTSGGSSYLPFSERTG